MYGMLLLSTHIVKAESKLSKTDYLPRGCTRSKCSLVMQNVFFRTSKYLQIYNKQDSPSSQPFILPKDALSRSELSNFNRCTYRFIGEGQVAQSNFQSPQMIPAHIVIFDQDTFGVMFLELR